jgi:hypothetical protein
MQRLNLDSLQLVSEFVHSVRALLACRRVCRRWCDVVANLVRYLNQRDVTRLTPALPPAKVMVGSRGVLFRLFYVVLRPTLLHLASTGQWLPLEVNPADEIALPLMPPRQRTEEQIELERVEQRHAPPPGTSALTIVPQLTCLEIDGCTLPDNFGDSVLARATKLKRLLLNNCTNIGDIGVLDHLAAPALESLVFRSFPVSELGVDIVIEKYAESLLELDLYSHSYLSCLLYCCDRLETLTLTVVKFGSSSLQLLPELTALTHCTIRDFVCGDVAGLQAKLPKLQSLNLLVNTTEDMIMPDDWPGLVELELTGVHTAISLRGLSSSASTLRAVALPSASLQIDFVSSNTGVAEMSNLELLYLPSVRTPFRRWSALGQCRRLRNLDITFTLIDDQGLAVVAELPNLTALTARLCHQVTSYAAFAHHPTLAFVSIDAVGDLDFLATIPQLSTLVLLGLTRLTIVISSTTGVAGAQAAGGVARHLVHDLDANIIGRCANLATLDLSKVDFDPGTVHDGFSMLKALRNLRISDCRGMGDLTWIRQCRHLHDLTLSGIPIPTRASSRALGSLPWLRTLRLDEPLDPMESFKLHLSDFDEEAVDVTVVHA